MIYTGTFEMRKLMWRLSRTPATGGTEDVDVCTFHFLKVAAGSPVAWTDSTDLPALETLLGNYWGSLKANYSTFIHSDQYRWYKDGPAFYELRDGVYKPLLSGNPAIRVQEVDVPGTSGITTVLPPQSAISVTEKTESRHNWGRWYLPAATSGICDAAGRILAVTVGQMLGYAVTFYNAARAAGYQPVVWSIQKPERPKKNGDVLPEQPARAYEVLSLQMDDLFDVIRSRRWDTSVTKTNTVLT